MRFYGFDGKMFAIIRHDVPRGAHGCSILQDVRRELVKYLFAVLPNACCERSVIKGQVRRHEGDGEWRVFVDGE